MRSSNRESVVKDQEYSSSEESVKSVGQPRRESGYKSDPDQTQEFPRDKFLSELEQDL